MIQRRAKDATALARALPTHGNNTADRQLPTASSPTLCGLAHPAGRAKAAPVGAASITSTTFQSGVQL